MTDLAAAWDKLHEPTPAGSHAGWLARRAAGVGDVRFDPSERPKAGPLSREWKLASNLASGRRSSGLVEKGGPQWTVTL